LHRPLLGVWRDELATYARSHELAFREDASNTDPRFTRNRLRHSLLPVLEDAFGREVKRALWRTAEILGSEEEWIANQTPHVSPEPLRTARVKALPVAIQRRVLHAWLRAHAIVDVSFEKVEAVRALLTDSRRAKTNLAEGRHARRRSGLLFIEP
jgi:tRNA(Ile)-lysidine synthase